jgi:hypothetical protein
MSANTNTEKYSPRKYQDVEQDDLWAESAESIPAGSRPSHTDQYQHRFEIAKGLLPTGQEFYCQLHHQSKH